jgi:hypothetical protein
MSGMTPRQRFRLASTYIRIECGPGERHERWRRWSDHCRRVTGFNDSQIVLDCVAGSMSDVHNAQGGIHPRVLSAVQEAG